MKKTSHLCLLALALLIVSCQKNEFLVREDTNEIADELVAEQYLNLPPEPFHYGRILPKYLQTIGLQPAAVNDAKATVGQVLFYDKALSKDRQVSCASCHKQTKAFADDVAFSAGINGLRGSRNSMPIANVASFSAHHSPISGSQALLLWDNRAANVAEQAKMAFLNDREMGLTMQEVVQRVKEQPYYKFIWNRAYPGEDVSENHILECLSEFVGAIGSQNSRFDEALEKANGDINFTSSQIIVTQIYGGTDTTILRTGLPGFSSQENRGRKIFFDNCSKCHSPIRPLQEVLEACNGLDLNYADPGKGKLTGNPADNGVFKAPSLRNIALTAPYMHDGRFKTLAEVVEFYSTGVKNHPNLHPLMLHNGSANLQLTAAAKQDLLSFLHTLTDHSVAGDKRFANPFKF